jgi:hypothetical protein
VVSPSSGPFSHLVEGLLDAGPPDEDAFEAPTIPDPDSKEGTRPFVDHYIDLEPEGAEGFAGVLIDCWRDKRTGVLRVQSDLGITMISLDNGNPVFAESTDPDQFFGRMLVRLGKLDEAQLQRTINACGQGRRADPTRFGEVLVESGLLDTQSVYELLLLHCCETILVCFGFDRMRARFGPGREPRIKFPYSVPALVREGLERSYDQDRVDAIVAPWVNRRAKLRAHAHDLIEQLGLTPVEHSFLERFDGRDSLGAASQGTMLQPLATTRLIAAFILLDMVDLVPESDVHGIFESRKLST